MGLDSTLDSLGYCAWDLAGRSVNEACVYGDAGVCSRGV